MKKQTTASKTLHRDAATGSRSRLFIHAAVLTGGLKRDYVLYCARLATKKLSGGTCSISFIIISDKEMAKLHKEYSGIAGTTDVLTFDLSDPKSAVEGEIYICLDQAKRQAAEYKVTVSEEIARLAVHGVLHLAGYDDHTAAERETMRQLEDEILMAGRKSL
jgi:rRNA maturation RNase YbeY